MRALWFPEDGADQIGRTTVQGTITEYPLPARESTPLSITSGPDRALWFTDDIEALGRRIGRITPGGAVTGLALPDPQSIPLDIAAGPDRTVRLTEKVDRGIGQLAIP
jgi:virginiamycin B lyase